jgi:Uma2 family endonuclease
MQSIKKSSLTMEEFIALPEGTLAEFIHGNLFKTPAPSFAHQQLSRNVFVALLNFVGINENRGELIYAPCDVFLDKVANVVQPDIIYISPENRAILKDDAIHGVPDLLIEILSPSNSKHDLILKKELYEQFGVREYWIVSQKTGECIGYSLRDGKYGEPLRMKHQLRISVLGDQLFEF